jgi:hypothetical protein
MGTGSVTIHIPEDTMHSIDTGNNKIIWSLWLEGSIPDWPDVSEYYEFTVLPM